MCACVPSFNLATSHMQASFQSLLPLLHAYIIVGWVYREAKPGFQGMLSRGELLIVTLFAPHHVTGVI